MVHFANKNFSLELGPKNWGLICFNLFFFKRLSVSFAVLSSLCSEMMVGCREHSHSLCWFGMLQLSARSPKEEHMDPISEEVTSFHQCLFAKAQSLACFAWFQEIGLRICKLLEGRSFSLVPVETYRRWGTMRAEWYHSCKPMAVLS